MELVGEFYDQDVVFGGQVDQYYDVDLIEQIDCVVVDVQFQQCVEYVQWYSQYDYQWVDEVFELGGQYQVYYQQCYCEGQQYCVVGVLVFV